MKKLTVMYDEEKAERKKVPSEETDMAWLKAVDHSNNSYLVLVNQAGRTIKAGEQIMFFYGGYSNAYLLMNYGFAYRENKYEQFDVSLEMKPKSMRPSDIVNFDYEHDEDIQRVQLK